MSLILVVSIAIRLAAMSWSIVLWKRMGDGRMGFLTVMLGLMASRQALTLVKTSDSLTPTLSTQLTELPGLAVSVMAFLAVFFLGRFLGERRAAAEEKQLLIGELQQKNLELERFLYSASHDLQSPLVTINGFLGLLQRDATAGEMTRVSNDVRQIETAVEQMRRVLHELLEYSRVGVDTRHPQPVSLEDLADECLAWLDDHLELEAIELVVATSLPSVLGDRDRLFELLRNLLENAVKFTRGCPERRIEIGARRNEGEAIFFVADSGCGVESEYQEKIFGLFERLDARIEGTGIGLAIVRRIAESHGGRAWVESDGRGRGSTFFFSFPNERVIQS